MNTYDVSLAICRVKWGHTAVRAGSIEEACHKALQNVTEQGEVYIDEIVELGADEPGRDIRHAVPTEFRDPCGATGHEQLIADLWWFIENCPSGEPGTNERFFALRERVRRLSDPLPEPAIAYTTPAIDILKLFTAAAHDARDALNKAGLACPASIALAAEQARAAIRDAEER